MRHIGVALCLTIAALLPACRGANRSVAPDGREFPHVTDTIDRNAPTIADLAEFTFSGTDAGTVTLAGGVWRDGPPGDPNASSVELLRNVRVTGDITGNGTDEAVVLLESRRPPAASRVYLAVVGWVGGQLVNIATTPLSEDVQIKGGHIEPRRIILDGVRRAAAGATPAPVKLTYELSGTTLRLISAEAASAPASAVLSPPLTLAGTSWRLVQFQSMNHTALKLDAERRKSVASSTLSS